MNKFQNSQENVAKLAVQLRLDSIKCTTEAGSGHPTSSLSAADLMSVLMTKYLRYNFENPAQENNDRLIFSKGHAVPLLYSMYKAAGVISNDELLSLRKAGSRLQGHPNPRTIPWVDAATGSLGQGINVGVGMALCGKKVAQQEFNVWVLLGDSEMAEGSVWEAFDKASYYKLGNLVAIIDMNRLGQRGETDLGWASSVYAARARAFGWNVIEVDGHSIREINQAFAGAISSERPTCIVAKTVKGKGVSFLENKNGWHGKALTKAEAQQAFKELGGDQNFTISVQRPEKIEKGVVPETFSYQRPVYESGSEVATRKAYGDALAALGKSRSDLIVLDAEVGNSTHSEEFLKTCPERFFEMFIAEQQMVSAALGFSALGKKAFASTFACFLTRAYDQIRMAAISNGDLYLCGSHAGVSIGEDGPSQMGLEDLAMMRAVFGSTVLYPSDAVQTVSLMEQMPELKGIVYLRTTRGKTPVIYSPDEKFPVGGSKVHGASVDDSVAIVAAGITLHEALKAQKNLASEGIHCRVIDLYSIKPVDRENLHESMRLTEGRIVVVEDHWAQGGIGEAVLEAVSDSGVLLKSFIHLAVREMPGSGKPEELLITAGIDSRSIEKAVRESVSLPGNDFASYGNRGSASPQYVP
jgi:transketolase